MDRNRAISENGHSGVSGNTGVARLLFFLPGFGLLALLIFVCWYTCYGSPRLVVLDLWDMPHSLDSICNGEKTLFFLCNPKLSTCREGAVYFDSQSDRIRARGIQPAYIFVGRPEQVRDIVLTLGIQVPVYIDHEEEVYGKLLGQKVMPAMMLLDGGGNVIRTVYGGGQSLDNNLSIILGERQGRSWSRLLFILVPIAVVAAVLFLLN